MFALVTNFIIAAALVVAGAAAVPLFPPLYRLATRLRARLPFGNPPWLEIRGAIIVRHGGLVPEDGRYERVPGTDEAA